MSYLDAPQTAMLATHCAACGKALCDALSVEVGMGPDCREKYGYTEGPDSARPTANVMISKIAKDPANLQQVVALLSDLREIGFNACADKLGARLASVEIQVKDGRILLTTPYRPAALPAIKTIPGRKWDKPAKVWTFPVDQKSAVWALLKECFSGLLAQGPKGIFLT